MSDKQVDLLRRDECQPLTTEQMADIKSQFHPSDTANVNIVPYHIYDEDGEEIRVGEVRKTIDGVKKSKPVYEVTINATSPSSINSWTNYSSILPSGADIREIKGYCDESGSVRAYLEMGATGSAENKAKWFVYNYTVSNNNFIIWISIDSLKNQPMSITLQYTKDSDTWQPV